MHEMRQTILGLRGYYMKTCNKCGNALKDDQTFCNKCGEKWVDIEAIKKAEQDKINQEKEAAEQKKAEREAATKARQEATQEKLRKMKEDSARKISERKAKQEEKRKMAEIQQGDSVLQKEKQGTQRHKVKNIITIIYLVLAAIIVIAITSSTPSFPASAKDISIERASNFFGSFICLILPALLVLIKPVKKYIPLFKKGKFIFTVLGWFLLIVIGLTVTSIIGSKHSAEFNAEKEKYNTEIQLQKEAEEQTKAEEEAQAESEAGAQAQAEEETQAQAEADAAAKVEAEAAAQAEAEENSDSTQNSSELSEEEYKAQCVDLAWAEVVKDRTTYVGTYLKKDLMVRQIGTDSITGETVYICGENKDGSYVGGTFTVYDRRADQSQPIELYDKIYVYGQITGIYMTWSSYNPCFEVKYVEFNGKFGE